MEEKTFDKNNRYLCGIMGVVVGDALGEPVQFEDREDVAADPVTSMRENSYMNLPAGSWTDDSSLTLALLSSIKDQGKLNPDDIMKRFVDWLDKGAYTPFGFAYDIGLTCERAIDNYKRSGNSETSGLTGERDNGNGSLMRIMPACIFVYEQVKKGMLTEPVGVESVHRISALTHANLRSKMACGLYYFMVKHICDDGRNKTLNECLQEGMSEGIAFYRALGAESEKELSHYERLVDLSKFKMTDSVNISSSGYVRDTLEAAVWSLLRTGSFEEALLTAVNLGDDSDTVGAVAGGLAGLYYGYDAIPADWLEAVKRRAWIEYLCLK